MSRTVRFTWGLPTTRKQGGPLPPEEIAAVNVQISADAGATFSDLGDTPPPETSLEVGNVGFGSWLARFTVTDTLGQASAGKDVPFDVRDDSAPGEVVDVQVDVL